LTGVIAFHILLLLLGAAIATRVISEERISNALAYLHTTIGITTPPLEQVRIVALIWLASIVVIVDGCLILLVLLATKIVAR
jgi:hypothetical protein